MRKVIICLLISLISNILTHGQVSKKLNIFFDCGNYGNDCYSDYVRQEIPIVSFMRDRMDADVQIIALSQWNTTGSMVSTFQFLGLKEFSGKNDTLQFTIQPTATDDDRRNLVVKYIKQGLVRYWNLTDLAEYISISLPENKVDSSKTDFHKKEKDKYDYWVFQFGVNGNANGNQNYQDLSFSGYASADRETNKSKNNGFLSFSEQISSFNDNGTKLKYEFQDFNLGYSFAYKLNEHWAVGTDAKFSNSRFSNIRGKYGLGATLEYSIFPYKEFNTLRWIVITSLSAKHQSYYDTTIYLKTKESFFANELASIFSYTQPWGSVNVGAFSNVMIPDIAKSAVNFTGAISWRITRGLNFALWGNYSIVRNQINIRKGDASTEELLIRNRELLSAYDYNLGVGFSYRFGSKYNDIVNPIFKGMSYNINL